MAGCLEGSGLLGLGLALPIEPLGDDQRCPPALLAWQSSSWSPLQPSSEPDNSSAHQRKKKKKISGIKSTLAASLLIASHTGAPATRRSAFGGA